MVWYEIERIKRRDIRASMKRADPTMLETALEYLEVHSRNWGSGYIREIIWQFIRRYDLTSAQVKRLEHVALIYLERPMSREFKYMCLTMAHLATPEFWHKVEDLLDADNPQIQVNAYCLYPYSQSVYIGEKQRLELRHLKSEMMRPWRRKHPRNSGISQEDLLNILFESENWIDSHVVELEEPSRVQISSSNPQNDKEFLKLDYSKLRSEVVLPKLNKVLQTGDMNVYTFEAWFYALHVLGQLKDIRAVPIIINFLTEKTDYKYLAVTKGILEKKALAILEQLGTPEAQKAIAERHHT